MVKEIICFLEFCIGFFCWVIYGFNIYVLYNTFYIMEEFITITYGAVIELPVEGTIQTIIAVSLCGDSEP